MAKVKRKRIEIIPPRDWFSRRKSTKKKNLWPSSIVTIIFWLVTISIIYFVDPQILGATFLLFAFIFATLFFTFSLLFTNSRRGAITATAITIFLILRYFGVGNILNFLLIAGLSVTIEYYFGKKTN